MSTFISNNQDAKPINVFVVLYPGHECGSSDKLRDALRPILKVSQDQVFTFTYLSESLESVDAAPVTPSDATWTFGTASVSSDATEHNQPQQVDMTFKRALGWLMGTTLSSAVRPFVKLDHTGETRTLDVLVIPGGAGSTMFRVDNVTEKKTPNVMKCMAFVKTLREDRYIDSAITVVNTGVEMIAQSRPLREIVGENRRRARARPRPVRTGERCC